MLGNYGYLKVEQWIVHEQIEGKIKRGLVKEKLEKISFSKEEISNLKWERKGKEFWHKGSLFDVVSTETQDDTTIFYCLNDSLEKSIIEKFWINAHKKSGTASNPTKHIVLKLIFQTFEESKPLAFISNVFLAGKLILNYSKNNFFYTITLSQSTPPPQFS